MPKFRINGVEQDLELPDSEVTLLTLLREQLGLTGTKYGCGEGTCGACTVLIDGTARRSCTMRAIDVAGKDIVTIEGISTGDKLHPVQEAFLKHGAYQCGYCTPGMVVAAVGLLQKKPDATEQEVIQAMDHNICRCGTYPRIVEAVREAGAAMKEGGR